MKLSDVLDKYYVMANGCSEIVGFCIPDPPDEAINIHFNDDDGEVDQYFNDQDIQLLAVPTGGFVVTDTDGEECQFTALDGVDLKAP